MSKGGRAAAASEVGEATRVASETIWKKRSSADRCWLQEEEGWELATGGHWGLKLISGHSPRDKSLSGFRKDWEWEIGNRTVENFFKEFA